MAEVVTWQVDGRAGLVRIDNPPVNAAGHAVRAGLVAAIGALEADPAVEVIALFGAGRTFIAGADIREFGKPPRDPWLPELCNRIETCAKPVVAVLHGAALGGGLEVAMAAHARVALPGAKLGLPEVTLGILPGAGGTQRAPRLVGVDRALELIVSGKPVGASEALAIGLVDSIDTGTPAEVARRAAAAVLDRSLATRRTGALPVAPDPEAIAAKRAEVAAKMPHLFSPTRCIDAVAAAIDLPLSEGLARERALFNDCLDSPQRAGLIHAFFAERAVAKIPEANAVPRELRHIGVVGAGTMGRGIASACLIAGLKVTLSDPQEEARAVATAAIAKALDGAAARGKLRDAVAAKAALELAGSLDALSQTDLVIEAAPEDLTLKRSIFAHLGQVCRGDAILATNTSYLDVNEIAAAAANPGRVLGLHFFAPAHVMRLLEVVVADATTPEAVATGFALAKRLRKVAVRSGVCDGFIGNRILAATRRAADEAVLMGASPAQVDRALEEFGLAMGPYAAQDLSGLDIGAAGRAVRGERAPVADALIARGELGRKTGAGFYAYPGTAPVENPALDRVLAAARVEAGLPRTCPGADEIVSRYMTAMVAEGCRILEEGIALRAMDIDAVLLFGYGFPRHRGGPMHYADTLGAAEITQRIEDYALKNPRLWQVPTLLRDRAAQGRGLLN